MSDSRWIEDSFSPPDLSMNPIYAISEKLTIAAIPEPGTLGTCMLLSGLGALGDFGAECGRVCGDVPVLGYYGGNQGACGLVEQVLCQTRVGGAWKLATCVPWRRHVLRARQANKS